MALGWRHGGMYNLCVCHRDHCTSPAWVRGAWVSLVPPTLRGIFVYACFHYRAPGSPWAPGYPLGVTLHHRLASLRRVSLPARGDLRCHEPVATLTYPGALKGVPLRHRRTGVTAITVWGPVLTGTAAEQAPPFGLATTT